MKIYAAFSFEPADLELLKRSVGKAELWLADPKSDGVADRAAFAEAEIVLGMIPSAALETARDLRWIQFLSVGVESYRAIDWARFGAVTCTNLRGVYADPMAQTALAGILALNRGIDRLVQLQERRNWQKARLHPRLDLVQGAEVLLLGGGSVNRRLRELLQPFGCTFRVYGRTSGDVHGAAELDAALARADIVCAALPETPETRGLLDAARLARMKTDAIFVNVGRGSLVDEAALVARLRAGELRGAVLDVTQNEPLPPDDPLWTCPHTILTQHTSAGSRHIMPDAIAFFATNLKRYRASKPLLNVVDWQHGY